MALSPRFALDTAAVLGGGFLAVSAMTFSAPVVGWLGFGVSTGFAVTAALGAALTRRNSQKFGHGLLALVGLWSLIAALVFSGTALTWLVFADALALVAVALGDLTTHELTTERVVHQLEVHTSEPTTTETAVLNGIAA
ncbi:MAG: hypothetical protein QOI17_512 [Gaiellales bacterium]|jgi:hypothetical protein|nr:hypothetical protein [Gaiellales bacterium]